MSISFTARTGEELRELAAAIRRTGEEGRTFLRVHTTHGFKSQDGEGAGSSKAS